ncbi:nuclear transport factor 2 family protein [Pseudoalteromonas luteoviolacea]|uniref:nuclear transport factor 2 family protein n=1 Tax=Pseudoalteromonas luteoviolacea TaxID=43657 RepID=UPI0011542CAB|nr:nuclear transport factor 2 family protein [Pseudoalteromonas luteoviolacea]TQF67652.1 nuclear transport factor 2 family protein [Pseudoalteromonas luteoviolacea]
MKRIIQMMMYVVAISQMHTVEANDDIKQIKQVIQWYFDGTAQGNPELVEKAFLPTLELQFVSSEGKFKRWLGKNYISNIEVGREYSRVGKIITIDVTGNSAMAKATITNKNKVYTDYLLLLKLDQGWRISNKIFTVQQTVSQQYQKQ